MNLQKHWAAVRIAICLSCLILLLSSCTAVSALKGEAGIDMRSIRAGISKADVEEILGAPIRQWHSSPDTLYCLYYYDAGAPPSKAEAGAHVFMDVVSLGLWEVFGALGELELETHTTEKIAISYDIRNRAIGLFDRFDDFDKLPIDGRSDPGKMTPNYD